MRLATPWRAPSVGEVAEQDVVRRCGSRFSCSSTRTRPTSTATSRTPVRRGDVAPCRARVRNRRTRPTHDDAFRPSERDGVCSGARRCLVETVVAVKMTATYSARARYAVALIIGALRCRDFARHVVRGPPRRLVVRRRARHRAPARPHGTTLQCDRRLVMSCWHHDAAAARPQGSRPELGLGASVVYVITAMSW